jgi:hypothetical protein
MSWQQQLLTALSIASVVALLPLIVLGLSCSRALSERLHELVVGRRLLAAGAFFCVVGLLTLLGWGGRILVGADNPLAQVGGVVLLVGAHLSVVVGAYTLWVWARLPKWQHVSRLFQTRRGNT